MSSGSSGKSGDGDADRLAAEVAEVKKEMKAVTPAAEWLQDRVEAPVEEGPMAGEDASAEATTVKTTTGVGGTWAPRSTDAKSGYEPKVSTWGVFERPSDISKAYGGGRKIGVGGYQESEDERAKKAAATAAKLAAYRKALALDNSEEEAHRDEILAALKESRQLMRYGATKEALKQLERVRPWLNRRTEFGGQALIELGLARVANRDDEGAREIFKLLLGNPDREIKRRAQQFLFQETAQSFFKLDSEGSDPNSEFAALARGGLKRSLGVAADKRYDLVDAYLSSSKRPPVDSLSEARTLLRSAAVRRTDAGSPQRLLQSLSFLLTLEESERRPDAEAAAKNLRGEWLLGFTVKGGSISFAPPDAMQQLGVAGTDGGSGGASGEAFERMAPSGLALVKTRGSFEVKTVAQNELQLRLTIVSRTVGPLPLPIMSRKSQERVLLLDGVMCVTQPALDEFAVWVRPLMTAPSS